jgi:glycosyltransferase involved in cell wall biosynthesis
MLKGSFRRAMSAPHFLGAVLHSNYAKRRYAAWGIPEERLEVVFNGFHPSWFDAPLPRDEARRRLGLDLEQKLAVYTGHVNATKGLDTVLGIAKRCPSVKFLFVGSEGDGLIQRLAKRHSNVELVGWQPFEKVLPYLFAADVLIQPPSKIPLLLIGNTVLPMKLFLYLAAGRPVLAPDSADCRELLSDDDASREANALLVPAGDAEHAAHELRALLSDPSRCNALGEAARQTATGLTWDARAEHIERFVTERLARLGARPNAET